LKADRGGAVVVIVVDFDSGDHENDHDHVHHCAEAAQPGF